MDNAPEALADRSIRFRLAGRIEDGYADCFTPIREGMRRMGLAFPPAVKVIDFASENLVYVGDLPEFQQAFEPVKQLHRGDLVLMASIGFGSRPTHFGLMLDSRRMLHMTGRHPEITTKLPGGYFARGAFRLRALVEA